MVSENLPIALGTLSIAFGVAHGFFGKNLSSFLGSIFKLLLRLSIIFIISILTYVFIRFFLLHIGIDFDEKSSIYFGILFVLIMASWSEIFNQLIIENYYISDDKIFAWLSVTLGFLAMVLSI